MGKTASGSEKGRALSAKSAKRVDTTIVVVAVAAAAIGAVALIGVLGQAWMGYTPSHILTYLPMLLLPIAFVLLAVTLVRAGLRRRQTEVGQT